MFLINVRICNIYLFFSVSTRFNVESPLISNSKIAIDVFIAKSKGDDAGHDDAGDADLVRYIRTLS